MGVLRRSSQPTLAFFQNRTTVGITFGYLGIPQAKGKDRKYPDGRLCNAFPDHSQVVDLSVEYNKDRGVDVIKFEFESGASFGSHRLRLCVESNDTTDATPVGFNRRDVWWKDDMTAESQQPPT
jgi:hypothetical protein